MRNQKTKQVFVPGCPQSAGGHAPLFQSQWRLVGSALRGKHCQSPFRFLSEFPSDFLYDFTLNSLQVLSDFLSDSFLIFFTFYHSSFQFINHSFSFLPGL